MADVVVVAGAPGSGKSTFCGYAQERLGCPRINLGWLRQFHLRPDWSNANDDERLMAFENLVFIVKNYHKHGFGNILVEDLQEDQVELISDSLAGLNCRFVTLYIGDDGELRRRVLDETRDSGFRDVERAVTWNRRVMERVLRPGEIKVDSMQSVEEMFEQVFG